jgi:hypothetical protein
VLDDSATKINGQGRVRLEPKQPVKWVPVWSKPPFIAELTRMGLGSNILHNDQPEPVALSSSEGLLLLLPVDFVLDVRHSDRCDPASVTALPQTVDSVDAAVHTHPRDLCWQKRPGNVDTTTPNRSWYRK